MRLTVRGFAGLAFATSSLLVTSLVTPGRAVAAAPSTVCHGYAGCSAGGFTTHGYQFHAGSSYWRMYAGNNCTNYVAFVESTVYGAAAPPFPLGDAGEWPSSAPRFGALVDHSPTVGSVAEWDGGSPGIPSPGHVAIVEAVGLHASYIVVSQQNILDVDGYDWIRINASSATNQWEQWPSHFIHFPSTPRALRVGAGTRFQWVEVRLVPDRFNADNLVFDNGATQVVTPGVPVSLVAAGHSSLYRVRFQNAALQGRYTLHVSGAASTLRALSGRVGSPHSVLRVRVSTATGGRLVVITVVVRPAAPGPTLTTSSVVTPTTVVTGPTTTSTLIIQSVRPAS